MVKDQIKIKKEIKNNKKELEKTVNELNLEF